MKNICSYLGLETIQVPMFLFTNDKYKKLSGDAKVIYSIMLDRMKNVQKQGWIDEKGEQYVELTQAEVRELLGCTTNTVSRIFKDLEDVGLIKRVHYPRCVARNYIQNVFE